MTTEDIQQACLADLGRQRQEELPLSNKERKGPSFAPTRRNGTGHYTPALREGLESKWDVKIDDEEAEQMKGLAVEDSRPWAKKITQDFIRRNPIKSAPLQIPQISAGRKRPKRGEYTLNTTFAASLGGLVPPGGSVKTFKASKPANAPSLSTSIQRQEAAAVPSTMNLPIRETKPESSEHVVINGVCKLLNAKDRSLLFIVSYAMEIQKNINRAYLVLSSKEKGEKRHDVLDLLVPETRGDCCRVCSKANDQSFVYVLQFSSASDAHKFNIYLESLQQAAAREDGMENSKASPTAKLVQAAATKIVTPVKDSAGEQQAGNAKLVDLDSPPRVPTIEDAAQKLVELMEKILPEAAAAGIQLSDDTVSDIEETAIDDWLTRGFLKSETDDMKSEVLDLLRLLVRIKRKAECRRQTKEPAMQSLKELDENTGSSRIAYTAAELKKIEKVNTAVRPPASARTSCSRITYTASEIESVARARASTAEGFYKSVMTPRRTPMASPVARICSPAAALANVSKHKDWLNGKPDQVMTPPESVKKVSPSSGGLGTSR